MPLLTRAFRAYSGWLLAGRRRINPIEAQRTTLLRLVRRARATRFGRAHDFSTIRSVADFQARVPIRRYEDFWKEYWSAPFPVLDNSTWPGVIPYFALTSGTTMGRSKYIPLSREMIRSNRRAGLRALMSHVLNRPDSHVLENSLFFMGGATELRQEAPGVLSGDLSGISVATSPWWLRRRTYPPPEIAGIPDWEERIGAVLDDPRSRNISGIAGQTAWLLAFLERALRSGNGDRQEFAGRFPFLELALVGGVGFAPYERRFADVVEAGSVSLREIYAASEGFIGTGNSAPGSGVSPLLDNGLFLEFAPLGEIGSASPTRHWMATVRPGIDYAIIISSNSGLWAYQIGDIVSFAEVNPPRILIRGRTDQMLSAFGEHLQEAEITAGVFASADQAATPVHEFAVGPVFPTRSPEAGLHLYIVEFEDRDTDASKQDDFIAGVDRELRRRNQDYADIRASGLLIGHPGIIAAPPGAFHAWMKKHGRLGGQNKIPRVISDAKTLDDLRRFVVRRK